VSEVRLVLRQNPGLRLDLRGITPASCTGRSVAEVEQLPVGLGREWVALAEFFTVSVRSADEADLCLRVEGDLSRCDRMGWQMAAGKLLVDGSVGDHAGGCMSGGELHITGNTGDLTGVEMAGGLLTVQGHVGDFAASPLPGSMDGMRGGRLVVKGHAGARFADRMRRGTAIVHGNTGEFAASRMVAGTVAVGGRVGAHVGYGMRRGSVVLTQPQFDAPPTFVPSLTQAEVFWQLLARDLARAGGPFEDLASRAVMRYLGDRAAQGQGELIAVR
jgi:formylmethanofuran dehydrogenase subunit C